MDVCTIVKPLAEKFVKTDKFKALEKKLFSEKHCYEIAVGVCEYNGNLMLGKKISVFSGGTVAPKCERGRLIGVIHTHPSTPYFSPTDLKTLLNSDLKFMCLIYKRNDKYHLKCVENVKDVDKKEDLLYEVKYFEDEVLEEYFRSRTEENYEKVLDYIKYLEKELNVCNIQIK